MHRWMQFTPQSKAVLMCFLCMNCCVCPSWELVNPHMNFLRAEATMYARLQRVPFRFRLQGFAHTSHILMSLGFFTAPNPSYINDLYLFFSHSGWDVESAWEMKQLYLNKTGRVTGACWHAELTAALRLSVHLHCGKEQHSMFAYNH